MQTTNPTTSAAAAKQAEYIRQCTGAAHVTVREESRDASGKLVSRVVGESGAKQAATTGRIDATYPGWFRALKPVDSFFQSWECVGWFRTQQEAEDALANR